MASSRALSPSPSPSLSCSSDSSLDEDFFCRTYVPLSNLPTPPFVFKSSGSSRQQSEDLVPLGEHLDPKHIGPAIHLANLIPASTTLTKPSVPLVHAMLTRANLPLETIALAVCILDSLNSRFALAWRHSFPLYPINSFQSLLPEPHIDSIHPEVMVLSALILAVKFVDDAHERTATYAQDWGRKIWTCEQINYTERIILENLRYRLLPLWNEPMISEAMKDVERARRQTEKAAKQLHQHLYPAEPNIWDLGWDTDACCGSFEVKGTSDGKAVMGLAEQLTPAETPLVGNVRGTNDVAQEMREAFKEPWREELLVLQTETVEPFPRYVDPAVKGLGF